MGASHQSGPSITYGPVPAVNANIQSIFGPSITYQGDCILDPRTAYRPGQDSRPGTVKGFLDTPYILLVDTSPIALTSAGIAALQNATSGTPLTLATCLTVTAATIAVAGTGYDNGPQVFTVNTGTANTKCTVSLTVVGGIPTGIPVIVTGGSYTVTPTVAGSATTGPTGSGLTLNLTVGNVNIFDINGVQRTGLVMAGSDPYIPIIAGVAAAFNPKSSLTRNATVTGSASATGGNITIAGYDIYGVPMSEVIAAPASGTTVAGKKAFKYIASATPAFSDAHNYSIGWGDVFGVNLRNNAWEYTNFYWNGAFITVSTGWLAAVGTTATTTTGDTRGTYAVQSASDGTKRIAMFLSLQLYDLSNATPFDSTTMYGAVQA